MPLWVQGFLSKLTKKTYAPVAMLSKEEVERDTLLQLFLARHQGTDGCWLAFKCTRNFLHDSDVTVKIDGNVHTYILPRFASISLTSLPRFRPPRVRLRLHARKRSASALCQNSAYLVRSPSSRPMRVKKPAPSTASSVLTYAHRVDAPAVTLVNQTAITLRFTQPLVSPIGNAKIEQMVQHVPQDTALAHALALILVFFYIGMEAAAQPSA